MKEALSALELRALEGELKHLIGAKVSQIYEREPGDYYFQVHVGGVGREIVRIRPPFALYLTSSKDVGEEGHSGFCTLLRHHLGGLRITEIAQQGFDRVLKVRFEARAVSFSLYIEFFGKGNVIFVNSEGVVLGALIERSFGSRSTKKQSKYQLPSSPKDPSLLGDSELLEIITNSKRDHLIKTLAIDLSMGGAYGEALCKIAAIAKDANPKSIDANEASKIGRAVHSLREQKRPCIAKREGKPIDVTLLPIHEEVEHEFFPSFSAAQEVFWTSYVPERKPNAARIRKETILVEQRRQKSVLDEISSIEQRRAELIYLHYGTVLALITEMSQLAKKEGWKALKTRYKDDPRLVSFDEKRWVVTLNLKDQ